MIRTPSTMLRTGFDPDPGSSPGQALTQAGPNGTATFGYDAAGRRTSTAYPAGGTALSLTYTWLVTGELTAVKQGTTSLAAWAYDPASSAGQAGLRTSLTFANGVVQAFTFDPVSRLASLTNNLTGTASDLTKTYAYNPASQITTETRSNDSYGFAKSAASTAYAVNGLNQYTTVGGTAQTYDANGNLTGTGAATYTYDIENRLVKAVAGATTTNLIYDPLGRLFETNQGTSATTTRFLNDGDALALEYNSQNDVTNRYVHGSNAAADDPLVWYSGSNLAGKRWLHADHLGSITAWTNSSGGSPTINKYDEYGLPAATNTGRFQYTGQVWIGELGLYYYKARFYSPGLGRFLQVDPVGYKGGINLYGYVESDPVNQKDPTGNDSSGTEGTDIANTCSRVGGAACAGAYEGSMGADLLGTIATIGATESDQQTPATKTPEQQAAYLRRTVIIAYARLCRCKVDASNFVALDPNRVLLRNLGQIDRRLFHGSTSRHSDAALEARLPGSSFALKVYIRDYDAGNRNTIAISTPTRTLRHAFDALVTYPDLPINTFYARQYCYQTGC